MAETTEPPVTSLNLPAEVDGVVVGAGHNGLVTGAYLAKAGYSVLVVETADEIGGGLTTRDLTLPLFRHNPHGFFIRWRAHHRVWKDLALGAHGCRLIHPSVQNGLLFEGGRRALVTYSDEAASVAAIDELSATDAQAFRRLHEEASDLAARLVEPLTFSAPLDPEEERERLTRSGLGKRYLGLVESSALEVITDWFETEPVRALFLYHAAVQGYLPHLDKPGTGLAALRAVAGIREGRLVEGGSQRLTDALAKVIYAHGGRILTGDAVEEISVREGRATGVVTRSGRRFRARQFVTSCLPEAMTMARAGGGPEGGRPGSREELPRMEYSIYGLHLALAEAPRFQVDSTDFPRALNVVLGYETSGDLLHQVHAVRAGRLPDSVALHASIPSMNDPSQAPPGHHVTFGWQFVPCLPQGEWGSRFDTGHVLGLMLDRYESYAPGLRETVLAMTVQTPSDTERMVPSMISGDHHHGTYSPTVWRSRRAAASGEEQYRTEVEGLYLCGSSQHPRGGVTGAPGFNAARVVVADLGAEPWWPGPDARETLTALE